MAEPTTTPLSSKPRSLHLDVHGSDWLYWSAGQRGRGMVLLGAALTADRWGDRLVGLFEGTHRVISPRYPKYATPDELVEGVIRLMDRSQIESADVFGHELGAGVAHALVRRHPERVDRLALVGWGLPTRFHRFKAALELWGLRFLSYGFLRDHWRELRLDVLAESGAARESAALSAITQALERHTRASAIAELHLMLELSRDRSPAHLREEGVGPPKVLLLFANDDTWFDRAEQDALSDSYPDAQILRFLWGGNLIGLAPAAGLEHKLELFFRLPAEPPHGAAMRH